MFPPKGTCNILNYVFVQVGARLRLQMQGNWRSWKLTTNREESTLENFFFFSRAQLKVNPSLETLQL